MGGSEEFETLLKDVVNGKRLSASKTTKLTEIALKNMQNDTQMVSILYRTHKTLPTSSKVASLYIFDALCRAARSQVVKHQLTGDIHTEKGNSATFLLKIEGILDGLIEDLMSANSTEVKEKTQKILDIWAKSTTFPTNVVKRLQETVKEKLKDPPPVVSTSTTSDPRQPKVSPPSTTPPTSNGAQGATPPPAGQIALPPSLVALLGPSFSPSTPVSDTNQTLPNSFAGLDPLQLSLLQQIAEQAKLNSGLAVAPTTAGSTAANGGLHHALSSSNHLVPTHGFPSSSSTMSYPHPHSPPTTDPRINSHSSRDRGTEKWDDHSRDRSHQSNYNGADRNEWRGGRNGTRGGSYGPTRGGGGGRGRWDDRGAAGTWREGAEGRNRSRSRSPPPRGRAQEERPRRDPRVHSPRRSATADSNGAGNGAGKDEFGRDIRATSTTPPPTPSSGVIPTAEVAGQPPSQNPAMTAATAKANPQPPTGPRAALATQNQAETPAASTGGLEAFDFTTFDFTSAASWEALGKAWEVSYGQPPSQEELMMAMSGAMNGGMMGYGGGGGGMGMMGGDQGDQGGWGSEGGGGDGGWQQQQSYNSDRGGRGRGRGRGSWRGGRSDFSGHGYGDYSNGYASDDVNAYAVTSTEEPTPSAAIETGDDGAGEGGGRMKRVGDKWVWQPPT